MPKHLLLDRNPTRPSRGPVIPHGGHAIESRPESTAMPSIARWMKSWGKNAIAWVCSTSENLGGAQRDERIFHELAEVVRSAHEPREIESALLRLACRMAGARHAELVFESNPRAGAGRRGAAPIPDRRLIARWPEEPALGASGADADAVAGAGSDAAGAEVGLPRRGLIAPLDLTVREGVRSRTMLRLLPAPGQRWSPRLVRQLTTLCTLAAAARLALTAARPETTLRRPEPSDELRDEVFFNTFLPYAVATAKRYQEPLSLLCVAIDRFAAMESLLGHELAEAALDRVAATIVKTLRSSDIVARIGEGRIIAALGFANSVDALTVAETLRLAIAGMGTHSPSLPVLTATIGVASYPIDGADAADLISAATEALKRGRSFGPNGVAVSSDHDPARAPARCLVGRRES